MTAPTGQDLERAQARVLGEAILACRSTNYSAGWDQLAAACGDLEGCTFQLALDALLERRLLGTALPPGHAYAQYRPTVLVAQECLTEGEGW